VSDVCEDCGRRFARDSDEWRGCDPMRETNVTCGVNLGEMDADETVPDCTRAKALRLQSQLSTAEQRIRELEREVEELRSATPCQHDWMYGECLKCGRFREDVEGSKADTNASEGK
jgi:hypothetical protein